ncbi:MAG: radical SAM protein [Clostridia bacterium]|nr:radical SAM protein [Clostridia bacterium]MDD4386168.1 radical SAM protein [Clostridia bacterium]
MENILKKCEVCPHKCKSNRMLNESSRCKATNKIKIALASIHNYEEPCISGTRGSGTIFFSNCNLNCIYCQNYKISQNGFGKEITIEHLADIFLSQQNKGAHNINLVSPTIYTIQIIESIKIAKNKGLTIPIIYNSGGYDSLETLKLLEGYIDIYLPDFKYSNNELASKYSKINNYFETVKLALVEMYRQVGSPVFDENEIIQKGMIIRHMILPNNIKNTKYVLDNIKTLFGTDIYISVMAQYFPTHLANQTAELNRKINKRELKIVEEYMVKLGFENGYIQKLESQEEKYVPIFDLSE